DLDALNALRARVVRHGHHRSELNHGWSPRLLRALHELHEAPSLVLREAARLHEADRVPDLALVLLVVDLELRPLPHITPVHGVLHLALDGDHHGLFHLVAYDLPDAGLAPVAVGRCRRVGRRHTA